MAAFDYHCDPSELNPIATALRAVPRAAYSVPHTYPNSVPAYMPAPLMERERPASDRLRLYVHIPFCRYHCSFCYFAVRVGASEALMQRYVRAVVKEMDWIRPGTPLSQLFVGGGTPTALPPALLDEVLTGVFARTVSHGSGVHTVETSPETITPEHIAVLKRHGIGRVSMGVQSLDEDVLGAVRREQTMEQALASCDLLVQSGLIVNVDRTPVTRALADHERFGIASLMRWRAFVKHCAAELGYTQTRWHTFKRMDSVARRHEWMPTVDRAMSGYQLGVGMSARSQLGYTTYRNHDKIEPYMERIEAGRSPVEQIFVMGEADRQTQFVARSLGDGKPLERARYEATFGRSVDADFGETITGLVAGGLVLDHGDALRLTPSGELLYDLVTLAFYPEHAKKWLIDREEKAPLVQDLAAR
jgi:oxygen-independent coproporphyrinogen-3 oxidase